MNDAPRTIWVVKNGNGIGRDMVSTRGDVWDHRDDAHLYRHDAVVRELVDALCQAAVPLEGLTLAAHATGSNMGLCKGTWDEINNGVAQIRAALAKIAQEDKP